MTVSLHLGDCLEVMRTMPDNSVDAIVTDPPYALTNRVVDEVRCSGCGWVPGGSFGNGKPGDLCEKCGAELTRTRAYRGAGFMGKEWDNGLVAFGTEVWAEALRVAKPGAHLLAFGGTRTFHRLTVAIEDAGWQIRDCLMWLHGQGFPKGKRVDEYASHHYQPDELCQCASGTRSSACTYPLQSVLDRICTVALWDAKAHGSISNGHYGSRKPQDYQDHYQTLSHSCDELLHQAAMHVLASVQPQEYAQGRSRFDERGDGLGDESLHNLFRVLYSDLPSMLDCLLLSSWQNVERLLQEYEGGQYLEDDLNMLLSSMAGSLDVSKLMGGDTLGSYKPHIYSWVFCLPLPILRMLCDRNYKTIIPQMEICCNCNGLSNRWSGWNVALKPAYEPIVMARKPLSEPTVAANVLKHGTGAINIGATRIGINQDDDIHHKHAKSNRTGQNTCFSGLGEHSYQIPQGRWPANVTMDEHAAALLDQQSGERMHSAGAARKAIRQADATGMFGLAGDGQRYGDTGGASRFFFVAKASKRDRDEGLEGMEETVKGSNFGNNGARPHTKPDYEYSGKVRNTHPTVKSTQLMRWLCRLICPPNGVILDPFMGSGSTGKAAVLEGFNFTGIDCEAEYVELAEKRIAYAQAQVAEAQAQPALLEVNA